MTSEKNSQPSPDDRCGVCNVTRVEHGDKNHVFNVDGILIAKEPGPEPKKQPPRVINERDQVVENMARGLEANAILRLTELLIEKGVLDSKDTLYIFSGHRS